MIHAALLSNPHLFWHPYQDLTHATLVFKAYLAGAGTQGSCATRLKGILGEGCFHVDGGEVMIHSLAKVLVQTLKATLGHGADAALGDCVADIPAVLLSLASSYCKPNPETPTTGALYDATTNTNVPCTPVSASVEGHWQNCVLTTGLASCHPVLAQGTHLDSRTRTSTCYSCSFVAWESGQGAVTPACRTGCFAHAAGSLRHWPPPTVLMSLAVSLALAAVFLLHKVSQKL